MSNYIILYYEVKTFPPFQRLDLLFLVRDPGDSAGTFQKHNSVVPLPCSICSFSNYSLCSPPPHLISASLCVSCACWVSISRAALQIVGAYYGASGSDMQQVTVRSAPFKVSSILKSCLRND